jgi:hypothetical protein
MGFALQLVGYPLHAAIANAIRRKSAVNNTVYWPVRFKA